MNVGEIVPEYNSKNIFVRGLFYQRLKIAVKLASLKLKTKEKLNVIDLGCGNGNLLKILESNFKNLNTYGVDILPEVLKIKEFVRAEVKICDLRMLNFPDNFFDVIFCLDTLEHFKSLTEPLAEIKRILKKDGLFIVSGPTESLLYKTGRFLIKGTFSMEKGPCAGTHFHNTKEIEKFILNNNFKLLKRKNVSPIPFLIFFKIYSFCKLV